MTIECRKAVADHIADVMSNEGGAIDLKLIENSRYVLTLRFLVVAARWPSGEPIPRRSGILVASVSGEAGAIASCRPL
jgi:hypothetical protein